MRAATMRRPACLEAAIDLADEVLADAIGLDDGKGAFDGHANPLDGAGGP